MTTPRHLVLRSRPKIFTALAWLWLPSNNFGYAKSVLVFAQKWLGLKKIFKLFEWMNAKMTKMAKFGFSTSLYYVKNCLFWFFSVDIFDNFNFWTTLFSTNGPNFCCLRIPTFHVFSDFLLKFGLSEKHKKIEKIFIMVWTFTK